MVRTSGGIRISAGKSSKKGGGAASRSAPSTPSGKTGSRGSSRLPPIPHCEAPSWQKPITNFFNAGATSSKDNPQITEPEEDNLKDTGTEIENKYNEGESSAHVNKINDNVDVTEEINNPDDNVKADTESEIDLNNMDDGMKRQKIEQNKENEDKNNI